MAIRQLAMSMATSASYLVAIAFVSVALKGNQATLDGNVKSNFGDAPNELVIRTTVTGTSGRAA